MSARNLVKRYGAFEAVSSLSFEVRAGEFFGLLGPNGAGKSTTMRMIYRVTPPTSGALTVLGFEAGRDDRQIKARLGVVPQIDNLDEELSVLDNLIVYARFHDISYRDAKTRAHDLLDFMELSGKANAKIMALSGGMKRRLTLARGLMNDPQIVVLDEPTTGLDPQVRITLWDKLEELRSRGVTLLMSTHYMDEAERLCDRLIIMDQGQIVAEGEPERLVNEHVSAEVVEMRLAGMDAERLARVAERLGASVQRSKERMSLFTGDGRALLDGLRREGLEPARTFIRPGNLEDVFLKLTGRSLRE
ncbi:MAG: ABC transporter ATP-binding protein [Trueperaceae bacterium]|nr:ABC transporter ATP-binding protein [Trueperaceae bacterium]